MPIYEYLCSDCGKAVELLVSSGSKKGRGDAAQTVASIEDVQAKFASVLGGRASDYDADTPVQTYGLDSLSSTVLVNWMNNQLQQQASAQPHVTAEFFDDAMTLKKMFNYLTPK